MNNYPDDPSELMAAAQRREDAAWERVVALHQEAVFRLAYLLLGDADDAADVAQEAFIRAYRAIDRFDTTRPPRPWLLRITANLSRNRRRAAGRYIAALRHLLLAEPPQFTSIAEHSSRRMEAQALWQAVRQLNHADQEVIYLRYFLELSEEEMATTLDVARGTVKSRLHRSLGRLRALIAREFPLLQEES